MRVPARPVGCLVACLTASLLLAAACAKPPAEDGAADLAVLARSAEGFAEARPGEPLEFPRDHGAHPDFRIEWWYLTANLHDTAGKPFGAQWTLFRFAAVEGGDWPGESAWQSGQVYMAHLGISTPDEHLASQRYARGGEHGGLAQAGVTAAPFSAWLDDWSLSSLGSDPAGPWLPLELHARQDDIRLQLRLDSDRPLVLQGDAGFSQKHPQGGGSYYYSHPFLEADGELTIRGQTFPVSGHAWLDREWSSQFLQADQAGWDWFALHLDSGEKLMLFRLRGKAGQADFRHGVLFSPNGERRSFEPASLSFEVLRQARVAGRRLPMKWRIGLADGERVLEIEALNDQQWMDVDFPYWEGFVRVSGDGPGSSGDGYMELVGYPAAAD